MKRTMGWIGVGLLVFAFAGSALAGEQKWRGTVNTNWFENDNWTGDNNQNPPGTNDICNFLGPQYTSARESPVIPADTNAVIGEIRVGTDSVRDAIVTVNGQLTLRDSNVSTHIGMRMQTEHSLTITGPGVFRQDILDFSGVAVPQKRWFNNLAATSGDLIIETAGFEIADGVILEVEQRNTATAHFKTAVSNTTASIQKDGNGTLVLYGQNKWTGFTQIQGTLVFATNNAIDSASAMIFQNNSIFETRGYDGEFSTLDINGAVTFDFGNTNGLSSQLTFASSSDTNVLKWAGTAALDIINFTEGVDSIRIGTDNTGLSEGQVTNITVNGATARINYQGYLVGGSPAPLPIGSIDYEKAGFGGDMTLTWSTHEFQNYDIEYKNSLIFDSWQFYTNVVGIGGTNMMSITLPAVQDEEFYRIISN